MDSKLSDGHEKIAIVLGREKKIRRVEDEVIKASACNYVGW
jgi:hypothetical protein